MLRRSERFRANCGLAGILILALVLRLLHLDRNGFGNEYYSAGVRSMLESWHNFFFNAFDPAGFVSLDKPPVALWLQVAAAKLMGFRGISILLPQALEGTASVALLYFIVRRSFGTAAALLAALFLAITPIGVAVDRSSNTDSCLVMVILAAAWALTRAAETGSRNFLLLSMFLLGIGFNVKMLAAFIVLPAFALVYLAGAPIGLKRRIGNLIAGGIVLGVVSLSWTLAYDLTPPEARPYAGGTTENSMMELVVGHNGLQRFLSHGRRQAPPQTEANSGNQGSTGEPAAAPTGPDNEPAGPFRLFAPRLAGQVAWLLPLALFGLFPFGANARPAWPLDAARRGLVLWGGWALTYGIVYSALSRLSPYYLVTMGPPLSALAGVGAIRLWGLWKDGKAVAWLPPFVLALAATWEAYIAFGSGEGISGIQTTLLNAAPLAGALLAVAGLAALQKVRWHGLRLAAICCGACLLLANPAAWSLNSVMTAASNGARPIATPPDFMQAETAAPRQRTAFQDSPKLTGFLEANHADERYLAATPSARLAAPIIIRTGDPVLAIGGFSGSDPILMQDELARMAAGRQIRFVIVGGAGFGNAGEDMAANQALTDWVKDNGAPVDPALWREGPDENAGNRRRRSGQLNAQGQRADGQRNPNAAPMQLYDLNPSAGLAHSAD